MADQLKQLAFKKFTTAELEAGTSADVLTTDASTHYVIKSIEATQSSDLNPVNATATLGLTAGLAAGEYASIGNVAKAGRVGLTGSAIMDASSTLTIRPTAQNITFADQTIQQGGEGASNCRIYVKKTIPSVNGAEETSLASATTTDRTGTTYTGNLTAMQNYPSGNYIVEHTNANGVDLRIIFSNGSGSGCSFEVWNADGTYYGYYYDSYDAPQFDGERYIFWVACDGPSTTRIRWYDLAESTTNLQAANTLGGNNGSQFCHGQTQVFADSPPFHSRTTYDNHINTYYQNRHTDGRRYLAGWSGSSSRMWMVEIPATLTNDSSTTPAPKWLTLSSGSSSSSGADRFGNNSGSAWNINYLIQSQVGTSNSSQLRLTYDPDKKLYYLWYCWSSQQWFLFSFSQNDWDNRPSGNNINEPNGTSYGLFTVSTNSAGNVNLSTAVYTGYSGNNGYLRPAHSSYYSAWGNSYPSGTCPTYIDGSDWYWKDANSSNSGTYLKCVKVNMKQANQTVDMLGPDTSISASFANDLFVSWPTPSASTIASRNYTTAPGLKVRVTGILSDQ